MIKYEFNSTFYLEKILFIILVVFVSFFSELAYSSTAIENPTVPLKFMRHGAMATEFEIVLYGKDETTDPEYLLEVCREAFAAVDALEKKVSTWRSDSYATLINRQAFEKPVPVSSDVIEIIEVSRYFFRETQGAFDITVGPLLDFWKERSHTGIWPTDQDLESILAKIGLNYVVVDSTKNTVLFQRPGMRLDFGGIAKGMALDRMAEILREKDILNARLGAGGSTYVVLGSPPGQTGWNIDVNSPYNKSCDAPIASVKIYNESLSTSSNAERYYEIGGKRYSHIINPKTGMPACGVASATVIAPTGIETDALSTAFFVLGVEGVRKYCETHPQVRAILLTDTDETVFVNFP